MPGPPRQPNRNTQHGVAAHPDLLWDFFDNSYITKAGVLIDYGFINGTASQQQAIRSTIETSQKSPGADFVTWEDCASVMFREVDRKSAQIRIKFEFEGAGKHGTSKTALGTDALAITSAEEPTMILRGIPTEGPISEFHRGAIILHEFGHVLGLVHEHQSPSAEGLLTLNEKKVLKHYGGDEQRARRQVLDKIQNATNYTVFDKDSIMVYPMSGEWLKHKIKDIPFNTKLSKLDEAFIRLMYPPDLSDESVDPWPFFDAMLTAGVPGNTAGKMLKIFAEKKGFLPDRLRSVRNHFNVWKEGSLLLAKPNNAIMRTIDLAALRSTGISTIVGDITRDKLFQGFVRNIVHRAAEQYGVQPKFSLPGGNRYEVARMLSALSMHDDIGQYVRYIGGQFSGTSEIPSNDTPTEETPQEPDPKDIERLDPIEWAKKATGSVDAHITKPKGGRRVTIIVNFPRKTRTILASNAKSTSFNNQDVDVKGQLYYNSDDDVLAAWMVRWTLEWVVFYQYEWDIENFLACFIPSHQISSTDLRSANEFFEGMHWHTNNIPADPLKWVNIAPARCTAHVMKPSGERTITIQVQPLKENAVFKSKEGSFDSNKQNIDVQGELCYLLFSEVNSATKAKWNPNWIILYNHEWDSENYIACFIPDPKISATDLGSESDAFEDVQWQQTTG